MQTPPESDNPYNVYGQAPQSNAYQEVQGPAIALIVVSCIALLVGALGLTADVFFILSGMVDRLEEINEGPISEYTQITIRMVWGILLLVASVFVLIGAIKMRQLSSFGFARAAAVVALIPMVGPCCILGIPFGVWAIMVLSRPHVRDAFR